jgi:hypothetical protein
MYYQPIPHRYHRVSRLMLDMRCQKQSSLMDPLNSSLCAPHSHDVPSYFHFQRECIHPLPSSPPLFLLFPYHPIGAIVLFLPLDYTSIPSHLYFTLPPLHSHLCSLLLFHLNFSSLFFSSSFFSHFCLSSADDMKGLHVNDSNTKSPMKPNICNSASSYFSKVITGKRE